jgi:hypothetical protein
MNVSFTGDPGDMYRKALGTVVFLHKGLNGEPIGGSFIGDLRDGQRRALEMEHFNLYGNSGQEERAPLLGTLMDM